MCPGVGHRDDATHRGPYQGEALQPELGDDPFQVTDLIAVLIGPGGGPGTLPMASDIRRNKVETVLEMSSHRVERLGTGGIPMDADHRRSASIAPVKVVQAQAVDRQECAVRLRVSCHRSSLSRSP